MGDASARQAYGLDQAARSLIDNVTRTYDEKYGFGSLSSAVYDTAWVALVSRDTEDGREWLFPRCLYYLLNTQRDDGSWGPIVSPVDGILNTAASLLALQAHHREPLQIDDVSKQDLQERITLATNALQTLLSAWDVATASHVGFEIIVPTLLRLLEEEGITFDFPGKAELARLNAAKMSKFQPEMLYGNTQMTALHSLEAFVGKIDFDKVAHHLVNGAMMASPSATAAYLMRATKWDEQAEAYLGYVARTRSGQGGVPSAFPSTYFEYTRVLSILLRAGFTASELMSPGLDVIVSTLAQGLKAGDGVIGFAPGLGADADDTARALMSLNILDIAESTEIDHQGLIRVFEQETHFLTYPLERDPSFTVNCNVLSAFTHAPDPVKYVPQIKKLVKYLCAYWWDADEIIKDKWNLSALYPTMLITEAFGKLLSLLDQGVIPNPFDDEMKCRISVTLFQASFRALFSQRENGSWNNSVEQTSYGILILSEARRLSFFKDLKQQISSSIASAVRFISFPSRATPLDYIWIEKVTYGSPNLAEVYKLAALKTVAMFDDEAPLLGLSLGGTWENDTMGPHVQLFMKTPLFKDRPEWEVKGSSIEASLFRGLLRARRLSIFPRDNMLEDEYFDIIPFTWTACNNRSKVLASPSMLFEMMTISFLNYQADEHMEAVVGSAFSGSIGKLRETVDSLLPTTQQGATQPASSSEAIGPLAKFVERILNSPLIDGASKWDRDCLTSELRLFLQAHITQNEDNARFEQQEQRHKYESPRDIFFKWVRTTASDHTSCPYSFAFLSCLLSANFQNGAECFPTVSQKYLSNAFCRHLATMCRMYNDWGSVIRDAAENNLNSVNFPEYSVDLEEKKRELLKLAEFERDCFERSLKALEEESKQLANKSKAVAQAESRKLAVLRMFSEVSDLYGQIHVIKDIASRRKLSESRKV
ncbi:terpene synthase family protein [Stachybotrys elegans]|uniref:Terpene synthase family protein n=1 Tax=Stachybotrys elegans TaxID=80388 RepID=A0A8K0SY70_9HYPO|nr:terpene synthase family protein [Stachybotrys elegans]